MEAIQHSLVDVLAAKGLRIVVILAVVLVCAKLIHAISKGILKRAGATGEREKRVATVVKLVDTSLRVMLFGAALLMALREVGLDITPLLTGAGIAGIAVGLGAQTLVKDVIAGFFILIENQIRVGDVIKVSNGLSGTVERMELRVTAIRDGDGTLHVIPNGEIKSVSNMTHDFGNAVVDVYIPYQADLKKASAALAKIADEFDGDPKWKMHLSGKPEFLGLTKLEATCMNLQIVVKTPPHSRWTVARELRARAVLALATEGVELPKLWATNANVFSCIRSFSSR